MGLMKTVLVTGASSGIGAATARHLAAEGHHVVLAARRADRLTQLVGEIERAGGSADAQEVDVTIRMEMEDLVAEVIRRRGSLDVLVANAGVMLLSPITELLVEQWTRMIDVNIHGVLNGIAAALPHFRRQGGGHFITIASIAAHSVSPTSAIYSATKHAAWAVTEGLRLELDPSIRVTTISPGVVESELATHITDPATRAYMDDYRRHAITGDTIARAIAYAMDQPADVDVNEIIIRPAAQRP